MSSQSAYERVPALRAGVVCTSRDATMTLHQEHTQVFIVRVWREPREIEGATPAWRGVIEHVASGERRYLTDLDELPVFIGPHLERMGVGSRRRHGLAHWFRRLRGSSAHVVVG